MNEVVFQFQSLTSDSLDGRDGQDMFATCFPAEAHWLREHAGWFRVSAYRWPEFVARLINAGIGKTLWNFDVHVTAECAEQFAMIKDSHDR